VNFLLLRLCLTRIFSAQIDPTPCFCGFWNSPSKTKRNTTIKCSNRPIGCPVMAIFVQEHHEKHQKYWKYWGFGPIFSRFWSPSPNRWADFKISTSISVLRHRRTSLETSTWIGSMWDEWWIFRTCPAQILGFQIHWSQAEIGKA
jgi:hypothetical protein